MQPFQGMHDNDTTNPTVGALVDAMLQSCGQLALIIDHMQHHESPDSAPIPEVLADLMRGSLAPLAANHGDVAVESAAEMLSAATAILGEELILADMNRAQRRAARRRGAH